MFQLITPNQGRWEIWQIHVYIYTSFLRLRAMSSWSSFSPSVEDDEEQEDDANDDDDEDNNDDDGRILIVLMLLGW